MSITKKILTSILTVTTLAACGTSKSTVSKEALQISIPDDVTNGARALKVLESAGLIELDNKAGYTPEIKDIKKYIYNIKIKPQKADTLVNTLDDVSGSVINNTFSTSAGLYANRDGLVVENQGTSGDNPYVNIIVARTNEKADPDYQKIVAAYQTDYVAAYSLTKYNSSTLPVYKYDKEKVKKEGKQIVAEVDAYKSSAAGKRKIIVGVTGSHNNQWRAVQKILDDQKANIYIELKVFDSYTLPNEALNSGEINLNAFQHKAFLKNEINKLGYKLSDIGDTAIAPLALYSHKYKSIDELKKAAAKKEE